MTSEGGGSDHDRDWREVLDAWRPPHQAGDWASPAMWDLLQLAADEPALRRLFPWTSMNELHVSETGDFRDYAGEPFPAIAASTSGFVVMAHPWGPDHVVLETADPAATLACMVRLMENQEPSPEAVWRFEGRSWSARRKAAGRAVDRSERGGPLLRWGQPAAVGALVAVGDVPDRRYRVVGMGILARSAALVAAESPDRSAAPAAAGADALCPLPQGATAQGQPTQTTSVTTISRTAGSGS
ncbi:DUF6193 family natural product biosynthesis protein [Streptacidiphilus jiangxiensis]|uniref:Uncharacterized protein n=1 Tax=Streptacidiphilus jiangxiensis TaxID=235985 RepID=A0A1H8A1Y4_STRJI|nr:DUF6193 family natural product biosynthesis protein [Streptacidiphilus jiangxiensis]SEM63924.1 hypothetical protein SAMN05414137_13946 [Streptacidiphilus jiangxiensis]